MDLWDEAPTNGATLARAIISTFEGNLWSPRLVTGSPTVPSTSELETRSCTHPGVQIALAASRTPALLGYGSVPTLPCLEPLALYSLHHSRIQTALQTSAALLLNGPEQF